MGDYEADAPRPSGSDQRGHGPDSERLLALLEAAEEGSRELDAQVARHVGFTQGALGKERTAWWRDPEGNRCGFDWFANHPPQFTTSLDAALTLVPEGWGASVHMSPPEHNCEQSAQLSRGEPPYFDGISIEGIAKTAILALCIASIRALAPADARASGASPQESKDFPP